MAQPSSFFLNQGLLGMLTPEEAQQATSAANTSFLMNFLGSGDLGRAYNAAQQAGFGVVDNRLKLMQQQAALAEAQRKRSIELGQQRALQDATEQVPNTGIGTSDPAYLPRNESGQIVAGPGYIPPQFTLNSQRLLSDPRYLAGVGNEPAAIKALEEIRQAERQRQAVATLARKYTRSDGTVDEVAAARDPLYFELFGSDTSKLKTIGEITASGQRRDAMKVLADKYKRPDGTMDEVAAIRDPLYFQLFGEDPSKVKTLGEIADAGQRRDALGRITKETPFGGAPGTPSAATQAQATKDSYIARINALNNAGLFEEAAKLTNQLKELFPEETFSGSPQFVQDNQGRRKAVIIGNRGTVRTLENVNEAVSANTLAQLNKPEIRETEGGLVRVNPMNGKITPIMAGGQQVQTKGEIKETQDGLVVVRGGKAVPVTMDGKPVLGKQSFTEDEQKSAGFALRMAEAEKGMNAPVLKKDGTPLLDKNNNPITLEQMAGRPEFFAEAARTVLPDFLGGQAAGNIIDSRQRQKYRQFQENWVRANLRAESGAAIGKDEMEKEIQTYFPKIGDSQEVIAQKAEARRVTAEAMRRRAGRAANAPTPLPPGGAAPRAFAPSSPTSTLGNLYQNYNLTPPSGGR